MFSARLKVKAFRSCKEQQLIIGVTALCFSFFFRYLFWG